MSGPQLYWCERSPIVPVSTLEVQLMYNTSHPTPSLDNYSYAAQQNYNDSTPPTDRGYDDLVQLSRTIDEVLAGPILASICIFGIFGNILNLVVLSRKAMIKGMERMEKSAHVGLIALALSDMCFCILALPSCFIKHVFLTTNRFHTLYHIYHEGLINTFVLSSTWLTVTMAVSRYVAICHPLKARLLIGMSFAKGTIVLVYVFSVLFNVPRFLEKAPRSIDCMEGGQLHFWESGPLSPRLQPEWKTAYQWLYFILGILLPLLSLIFCNVRLVQALRRSSHMCTTGSKHDRSSVKNVYQTRRITLTLVIIVVMYLILVSPAEVNAFLLQVAINTKGSTFVRYNIAVSILNTLQSINFSFNFILYCAINTYFRRTIKDIFCKWTGKKQRRMHRFRSLTNSSLKTSPLYSTRQSHTYISEMSTAI